MKDTEYAFAVASVRAQENKLLSAGELEQLISATSYQEALRMVNDRGISWQEAGNDGTMNQVWSTLTGLLPKPHQLDFLLVRQDYHNLKAAIKSRVAGVDWADYVMTPCLVEPAFLAEAVQEKRFDRLPPWMGPAAAEAYDLLTRTLDGQLCDILLDRHSLEATVLLAKEADSPLAERLADTLCRTADLKIALRGARTHKDAAFLNMALAECASLSKSGLVRAAVGGEESLLSFLESSGQEEAAAQIQQSDTCFEKWCEEQWVALVADVGRIAFGVEPLIAYYIAGETQSNNLRIILSMKRSGASPQEIRQRVRSLNA